MKLKCIVIDDEIIARSGIEDFISKTSFLEHTSSFGAAEKALQFLENNNVDIIFLDIQMPSMNGLEFIDNLKKKNNIIFTTAHREFALDGFELNAIDYLLKPISYNRFLKAVGKLKENKESESLSFDDHIFIKTDGIITKVLLQDILYFESANDYIFVYTKKERLMTLTSLKHIVEKLPKDKFIRIHRSYLVSLTQVKKIEGNLLHIGEAKLQVSRSYRTEVYNQILGSNLIERK